MTGPNYGRRSKALGSKDPRVTRNAQANTQDQKYVLPIKRERDGSVSLVLSSVGPLAIDPERGLYLRVAAPLTVQSHSPFALSIESTEMNASGEAVLVITASQVKDDTGTTLQTVIDRLQANKQDKIEKDAANGYPSLDATGVIPLAEIPAGAAPGAHATTHESGGSDEIDVTGLSGILAQPQPPQDHHTNHEVGASDEIDVTNLSGLLRDAQTPLAHASSHASAGSDPITIAESQVTNLTTDLAARVTGPASATDGHVVQFDGTTGKLVKDGGLTLSGTNTGDQTITLTGDVTGSGTGSFAATIANAAVTLAKMANMATASLFYRKTAGSGAPEVNTLATLKTDLGLTGTNSGDQTITLSGDVSGSGTSGITTTIGSGKVTLAMQANMATASVVYRKTAGSGAPEVQSLATLKVDLNLAGSNSGDQDLPDSYESYTKVGTTNFEAWHFAGTLTAVAATTRVVVANTAYAVMFIAPNRAGATLDRIAINATAAAGNVRLALYSESNGIPDTLKTDFGAVAASGVSAITISQALTPGKRYFLAACFDNTPTLRAISSNAVHVMGTDNTLGTTPNTHITATMTYGAFASTFPTSGMAAATGNVLGIAVRFSA